MASLHAFCISSLHLLHTHDATVTKCKSLLQAIEMDTGEDDSSVVANFCNVTSATPERARFFLESTRGQLEPALQLFFESEPQQQQQEQQGRATPVNFTEDEQAPAQPEVVVPLGVRERPLDAAAPRRNPKGKEKRVSAGRRSLVTTLGDLGKQSDSDSDSEAREYYTGGEKSGMVVQDPSKKHSHRDVEAIFERVRRLGAQESEPPAAQSNRFFSGSSHTLTGETRGQQPEQVAADRGASPIVHDIHFWRNGFTVNEGPLRRPDDPTNLPFLESINRSECPRELEPTDRTIPVHMNIVKRITDDWPAPPQLKYVAFKGPGQTLRTKTTEDVDTSMNTSEQAAPRPSQALVIDDAKPATSIQLRLSDGTRMVARFNTNHTVADIRGFIDAARPGSSGIYQLQTVGFPPVKLTNPTETIEGAGLLNAVVIQKG